MILFGHPTGSPFSHHAALSHFESGKLEAFCVPWMPTPRQLEFLRRVPGWAGYADRLARRHFAPLTRAPRIEGHFGEWSRMARRLFLGGRFASEALSYEANDWLMRTMRVASHRPGVTAVHAYEDCSLWSFEEAKRLGKACIYDLPIGYYPAWERKQQELAATYPDWLPAGGVTGSRYVRPEQKRRELELADLVLVPCSFVKRTVDDHAAKRVAIAPYGVDLAFWSPSAERVARGPRRFIYAGQCSLRKGLPVLLQAWKQAALKDAVLELVGAWRLADSKRAELPPNVSVTGPLSAAQLRERYRSADAFVFPSFFEGFGLVILEALACGLPVVATEVTAAPDILDDSCGSVVAPGDAEQLADRLRWLCHSADLDAMRRAARAAAARFGWESYRCKVRDATATF